MRPRALLLGALAALVCVAARVYSSSAPAAPSLAPNTQVWAASGATLATTGDRERDPRALAALGSVYQQQGDFERAREIYELVLEDQLLDGEVLMSLGLLNFVLGARNRALEYYECALAINASLAVGREHDLALAYHYAHDYATAESYYRRATDVSSAAFHFDFGVTLERRGKILEAADKYNRALAVDPKLAEAWLNIAALHHLHGDVNTSISHYKRVINLPTASPSLRLMAMMNVGVAYELMERVRSAMKWYGRALELLPSVPFGSEDELIDTGFDELWYLVCVHMLAFDRPSALLPFDTLLYSMDPMDRKQVAIVHSRQFDALRHGRGNTTNDSHGRQHRLESGRLHVGFLSYDFSNHPTTHLMEGVFAFVDRSRSKLIALGYGRDDGSDSRRRIVSAADAFVNMAATSFEESATLIRNERVHILMDAQGHTRGGRMKIVGLRPAPIIANYLVYPGTSGAAFVDYIISDAFVTPPAELARAFTEKLVLLPNSYQVNYYGEDGGRQRPDLWAPLLSPAPTNGSQLNLPNEAIAEPGVFVFVNFNKIDKVEAAVFGVWMAVMRRVPGSVLLLLDPSRPGDSTETSAEAKTNIFHEARALGIDAKRIHFLPRVPKAEHLRRHGVGALFLDTFTYGAHSTATDALYAGLPVLTLAGDSFASRVGVSLLSNAYTRELIAFSRREYEDLAVYLATHPKTLAAVRNRLRTSTPVLPPLFRTREHTKSLETSWQAMHDVHSLTNRAFHICVAPS